MKLFKCFWKKTRPILIVTLAGCATGYPKYENLVLHENHTRLESAGELNSDKAFKSYCSGNKQIKNLSLSFTFIAPKNPSGWPLDHASAYLKKVNDQRACLLQSSLYRLAQKPDCSNHYGVYLKDLRGENACSVADRNTPVWFFNSDQSSSDIEKALRRFEPISRTGDPEAVFVRSKTGAILSAYYFGDNNHEFFFESKRLFGGIHSTVLSELAMLMKDFTILEPVGFQKKAYSESDDDSAIKGCAAHDLYSSELIGSKVDGNIEISAMVAQRDAIWSRYISRFSKVKESSTSQDGRSTSVEVTLDLSGFCRYGKDIQDLISN